jgi:hypothetical protein
MSDMTDTKPANTEESQVSTQTTQTTESKDAPKTNEEVFTKAQLDEMLNKVRREEKDKLYKSFEKTKAQAESIQAERDKVLEDLKLAKEQLSTVQDSNMSDIEKVNKQIELLAEQNDLLKKQLETVSQQAEARVRESEVKSYKQKQIEKSGLLFPEMVSGNTLEEIDASISMLKDREKSVRQELEDRLRSERAQDVPKPMSPEMNQTQVASADRYRISKMSRDEYSAYRQKLMAEAMDAVRR